MADAFGAYGGAEVTGDSEARLGCSEYQSLVTSHKKFVETESFIDHSIR